MVVKIIWSDAFGNEEYRVKKFDCEPYGPLEKCHPDYFLEYRWGNGEWVTVDASHPAMQAALGALEKQ